MTGPRFDMELFRQLAAEGKTRPEIAKAVGLCTAYVGMVGRRHGIAIRHALTPVDDQREARMESMFRQGVVMERIASQFGITRERVRQLLEKRGVSARQGGASFSKARKTAMQDDARDARYMLKYGHPFAVVKELRKARITHAFNQQRQTAIIRGIPCRDKKRDRIFYKVIVCGAYVGTFKTPDEALAARSAYLATRSPQEA